MEYDGDDAGEGVGPCAEGAVAVTPLVGVAATASALPRCGCEIAERLAVSGPSASSACLPLDVFPPLRTPFLGASEERRLPVPIAVCPAPIVVTSSGLVVIAADTIAALASGPGIVFGAGASRVFVPTGRAPWGTGPAALTPGRLSEPLFGGLTEASGMPGGGLGGNTTPVGGGREAARLRTTATKFAESDIRAEQDNEGNSLTKKHKKLMISQRNMTKTEKEMVKEHDLAIKSAS